MRIPIQTHVSQYITIQFPEAIPTPIHFHLTHRKVLDRGYVHSVVVYQKYRTRLGELIIIDLWPWYKDFQKRHSSCRTNAFQKVLVLLSFPLVHFPINS